MLIKSFMFFPALLFGPCAAVYYRESKTCQGPGILYTGSVNETKRGRTCQNWNETSPQKHEHTDVGEHNFCRNPSGDVNRGVWCFTTTKYVRWEKCNVPLCEDPYAEPEPESESEPESEPISGESTFSY